MSDLRTSEEKKKFVSELIQRLRQVHPDAHCELDYETPLQLLVATILSAQCTDVRVNRVTPGLFARYPTAVALANADRQELEAIIRPTGFFRQKARYIQEASRAIVNGHEGQVPASMDELLQLRGVARKTANVVLGEIYGIADGVTVDTHVKRLAQRFELTKAADPARIERDLMALVPRENWIEIAHLLIFHGRRFCRARKPDCAHCPLNDICPSVIC